MPDRALEADASVFDRATTRRSAAAFRTLALGMRAVAKRLVEKRGSVFGILAGQHHIQRLDQIIICFFVWLFPIVMRIARVAKKAFAVEDKEMRRGRFLRVQCSTDQALRVVQRDG